MTNLTVYNGSNTQQIALNGLVDQYGVAVAGATITASLYRTGSKLTGSDMTFGATSTPGNYTAVLSGFDAPTGSAEMRVSGVNGGSTFNFQVFVTVATRTL